MRVKTFDYIKRYLILFFLFSFLKVSILYVKNIYIFLAGIKIRVCNNSCQSWEFRYNYRQSWPNIDVIVLKKQELRFYNTYHKRKIFIFEPLLF